jgi:hypothetical protein
MERKREKEREKWRERETSVENFYGKNWQLVYISSASSSFEAVFCLKMQKAKFSENSQNS